MTDTTATNLMVAPDEGPARIERLLAGLQNSNPLATDAGQDRADDQLENHLALVRLGMASSLFYALRTKHAPTAAHSLRVALSCSAWSERLKLDQATRDRVEVAALLHDLGKIGIPDRILRKPGKLSADEQLAMDCCPDLGCEILRGCTDDNQLLEIVLYASRWFDSRRQEAGPSGHDLPVGARMLAIADAFDAMTTDSVYRPAMSRELAIQELIDGSGTQFDPQLAIDFHRMLEERPEMLQGAVVNRWLQQLRPAAGNAMWGRQGQVVSHASETVRVESLFYGQLIGNMTDGVVFTDGEATITQWNEVMQRLTGIATDAIVGCTWSSESVRLREHAATRDDPPCLVRQCLLTGTVAARPMLIEQPGEEPIPVQVQVSPVVGMAPGIHGTVVIVRDLSRQVDLEEKLQTLHHQTTRDPLTGVANRAFFDQTIEELTAETTAGGPSFSLIMCDIDHFKRVNDVHGHQAGDEALVSFASILSSHSREVDMVARYGGEEFLLLAASCDNATAARRAEAIRQSLESAPLPSIGGESVTASFGVTEYQPGDTAETIVCRADRALLKAKHNGRNRVVQLGSGRHVELAGGEGKKRWFGWFGCDDQQHEGQFDIVTPVPVDLAIEKLRGFIADHKAKIISVGENSLALKISARCYKGGRRRVDQRIGLRAELTLSEWIPDAATTRIPSKTNVHVSLQPIRNRDRRAAELSKCFARVITSLRSYLIGDIRNPSDA